MTQEQIAELARGVILEQGFKPSANEWDRGFVTVRILTLGGAAVGSVSIPPFMTEWDLETVRASVRAHVLDSCAFAANEPALRAEQKRA